MRPDRNDMFLEIARVVSEQSTCPRASVGAVIVRDRRIISMGYNGAPPGMTHCLEAGCEKEYQEFVEGPPGHMYEVAGCARTIHAEANALLWAARSGIAVDGATMYCTHAPCYTCAKAMISAGIEGCHYNIEYRDTRGVQLLDQALVQVRAHV